MVTFIKNHEKLSDILMDQKLAKLGDAYVNFLYSLALSKKEQTENEVETFCNLLLVAKTRSGK
ncbi:MAG: hypothetical protein P8X87_05555 [Candidatus Bathyarchaeota archaeon]